MKKSVQMVCAMLLGTAACASPDSSTLQQLKFRMIRNAAVFYAKDTGLVKQYKIDDCSGDTSLAQLKSHLGQLRGVNDKLDGFNAVPVPDRQNLAQLKDKIISEVVEAHPGRLQLPGYTAFEDSLNTIAATPVAMQAAAVIPGNKQTMEGNMDTSGDAQNSPPPPPAPENDSWLWYVCIGLALMLSAIAIVLSGICFTRLKKLGRKSAGVRNPAPNGNGVRDAIAIQLREEINRLKQQVTVLESGMAGIQGPKQASSAVVPDTDNHHPVQTQNLVKYAKTADGNGFVADTLSDRQDNKKIFELVVEGPDKGSFRVTANPNAQQFALEDPYNYLRGACNYSSLPGADSRIITVSAGRMELNAGKWVITRPAEIEFSK